MKDIFDFSGVSLEQMLSVGSKTKATPVSDICDMADMPLAMAFVKMQTYKKTYEPDSALTFGTIFPELNKPFCGCSKWGDRK